MRQCDDLEIEVSVKNYVDKTIFHTANCARVSQFVLMADEKTSLRLSRRLVA